MNVNVLEQVGQLDSARVRKKKLKAGARFVGLETSEPQKQELNSLDNISPTQPEYKRYPKSPFQIRHVAKLPKNVIIQTFCEGPLESFVHLQPTKCKQRHKKGKSMDIEYVTFESTQDHRINIHDQNGRMRIDKRDLNSMRSRNTISELREYPFVPCTKRSPDKDLFKKKSKPSTRIEKQARKSKKQGEKEQARHCLDFGSMTSRPSKPHSIRQLNKEYRSLELLTKKVKLPVKQKLQKKQLPSRQAGTSGNCKELVFKLPSKINSLYSNTTSLFSSKTELEPFTRSNFCRINTEEGEGLEQIRLYESQALQDDLPERGNVSCVGSAEQNAENFSTREIIQRYVTLFQKGLNNERRKSSSESAVMQLISSQSVKSDVFVQEMPRQETENDVQSDIVEKEEKMNAVIKLISETQALGQANRETLLSRMRQLVPIAGIGSKELQPVPNEEKESEERRTAILSQVEQNPTYLDANSKQLYNIDTLDRVLAFKKEGLEKKWENQLLNLELKHNLYAFDIKSDKQQLRKQFESKLAKLAETREQLWKSYNCAKSILQQNDWTYASDGNERNEKQEKSLTRQQMKIPIQKDQANNILDQLHLSPDHSIEVLPLSKSQKQYHLLRQSNDVVESPFDSENILKQHIFIDSAERLSYEYEDDSPDRDGIYSHRRLIGETSEEGIQSSGDSELAFLNELSSSSKVINNPFASLSQQQKEDINEYIFIDVCLEIADELEETSKAWRQIVSYIRQLKERGKRRKGLKSDPAAVKEYLKDFIFFLKHRPQLLDTIHQQLSKPLGPTVLQILSYIHPKQQCSQNQIELSYVLSEDVFQEFDRKHVSGMKIQKFYEDEEKENKRKMFIRNATHIHNKAILDAYNEILDKNRPFGLWGQPFPWKPTTSFKHARTASDNNMILLRSATELFEISHTRCGFLLDKQECSLKQGDVMTEGYLERLRNEGLYRLLQSYMQEVEEKLQFIDDEETELLVMVGEDIEENLIQEAVQLLLL